VLALTVLAPALALGYILPAEPILAGIAKRRSEIAFVTLVAEGTHQKVDGPVLAVWECIRAGKAHRIERKGGQNTELTMVIPGKRWTFKLGERASAPVKIPGDLMFSFLGTTEKDPGGQRGLAFLKARGIDDSMVSLARFDRRVSYVIGAQHWEVTKPQLWIDKELSVPTRLIEVDKQSGAITDTRLYGFGSAVTGEWFPQRVEVWRNGSLAETTTYTSARLNEEVNEDLPLLSKREVAHRILDKIVALRPPRTLHV
jgi:hypothetical protein